MKISLAPLQGYTDWVFRQAYQKYIGGIDEFYTPFLVLQNSGTLKTSHQREAEPFVARSDKLIPQFLCGSIEELKFFENYLSGLGYQKMNWNLGCPYPMVTKRGKGCGLLPYPEKIREILQEGYQAKLELSIKMRLGLNDESEIFPVLEVLKDMPIDEIIIHPRIGKQMYKGSTDWEVFGEALQMCNKRIAFNGDINCVQDFEKLIQQFPQLNHVMIGRGVLKDLFLPAKIKSLEIPLMEEQKLILKKFHDEIFSIYSSYLSGDAQVLQKMKPFWEYFSSHFESERKVFKSIKKSSGLKKYEDAVNNAFREQLSVNS